MSIFYSSWIFRSDMYTVLCQVVTIDTDLIATYIIYYIKDQLISISFSKTLPLKVKFMILSLYHPHGVKTVSKIRIKKYIFLSAECIV